MKLFIAAAALLLAGSPPVAGPEPVPQAQLDTPDQLNPDPMNFHREAPGCRSILRQVQEESKGEDVRRGEARTLDLEPPAHLLLAVDRQVDGCREVTFLRRNVAPGSNMPIRSRAGQADRR